MSTQIFAEPKTSAEDPQLLQTIEMFEVITQSQPHDTQSLEILKEAYSKLGRNKEFINASKRIAQAYIAMGQLSSAILEYESILQRFPDDPDVQKALEEIAGKANNISASPPPFETDFITRGAHEDGAKHGAPAGSSVPADYDDGKAQMHKMFVETKEIAQADFDLCWVRPNPNDPPRQVIEPFLQVLADRAILSVEKSLRTLINGTGLCYLPLERYEVDTELARTFPREVCLRWCVLPFDRMGKAVLVATTNPFHKQAALDLEAAAKGRLLWYLTTPPELVKAIKRVFR
jgi:tetratricopeptide (TPR) repeat protein